MLAMFTLQWPQVHGMHVVAGVHVLLVHVVGIFMIRDVVANPRLANHQQNDVIDPSINSMCIQYTSTWLITYWHKINGHTIIGDHVEMETNIYWSQESRGQALLKGGGNDQGNTETKQK